MFTLISHNRRSERIEKPTLQQILAIDQPFIIQRPRGSKKYERFVFGESRDPPDLRLRLIHFLDHERDVTYWLDVGTSEFSVKWNHIQGPWHADKISFYGSKYGTTCTPTELRAEFQALGFTFQNAPEKA